MSDGRESSFINGNYVHFEASEYLHGQEASVATAKAKYAVERYMSARNPLFEQLEVLLGDEDHGIRTYIDEKGVSRVLTVVTNTPKDIATSYPDRIWVKSDAFEHENCYLGITDGSKTAAFVNFVEKRVEPVDLDLLGEEMNLFIHVAAINQASESLANVNV